MTEREPQVAAVYQSDEYLRRFPDAFREDTAWKLSKIRPLLDLWVLGLPAGQRQVSVLEVGGGAGLVLRGAAEYLRDRHGLAVAKQALELSPGMLALQRENNPDLVGAYQEDIARTSLGDKGIDLVLLIDVLEHLSDPAGALAELRRIGRYVLFKVPLEAHWATRLSNVLNRGQTRRRLAQGLGHVNLYTAATLRRQIERHLGPVRHFRYANAFAYAQSRADLRAGLNGWLRRLNRFCAAVHPVWPGLASRFYTDFALVLAACG